MQRNDFSVELLQNMRGGVEYEIEYKGVNASEEVTGQESDRRQQS